MKKDSALIKTELEYAKKIFLNHANVMDKKLIILGGGAAKDAYIRTKFIEMAFDIAINMPVEELASRMNKMAGANIFALDENTGEE